MKKLLLTKPKYIFLVKGKYSHIIFVYCFFVYCFENIGYPTVKTVEPNTMDYPVNPELFLLHTKDRIRMNYFVPKAKEFITNGTAPPRSLGTMIDQYYLYNDEPQIYGTYGAQGGGYANMIEDLKKLTITEFR